MTCILAYANDDMAGMACDTESMDGWLRYTTPSKIAKINGWLCGSSGPVRVNNTIRHRIKLLNIVGPVTEKWVCDTFLPDLMREMTGTPAVHEGWIGGKEDSNQGTLLFAKPGSVFVVQADWSVDFYGNNIHASIGSGQRFALAAFESFSRTIPITTDSILEDFLKASLDVTNKFDRYCGHPINIEVVRSME